MTVRFAVEVVQFALLAAIAILLALLASMVIGLSLPEAVILKRVLKMPLLITYFVVVAVAIMLIGYMFNWIL